MTQPEILDRRIVYSGYLTVVSLTIRLRDGSIVSREVEHHGDAAACRHDRNRGRGGGAAAEHENITRVERPLDSLAADARGGLIVDGKLLTLVLALELRRPELFAAS
jgi:hypothetical protein